MSRVPAEDSGELTYADPTGDTTVRLVLGRDLVVYDRDHPVFVINSALLIDLIGKRVDFVPSRRGRMLRAHKKKPRLHPGLNQNNPDKGKN
ncbi:hypothetical protein [Microbacterium sp. NPDC089696]|uniref:hypothetical protein n=1 Tax=Microbacterium sp. NPDC089696 TaxID=3364199 RepID=UPI0038080E9F